MSEPLIIKRFRRNLRYRRTYIQIYEEYLHEEPNAQVQDLLRGLIESQRDACAELEQCLRRLDGSSDGLMPYGQLMADAAKRSDVRSRLLFIQTGLKRAVDWYTTQLLDQRVSSDPENRRLLVNLGESESAQLWRTEAVMHMLRVPVATDEGQDDDVSPFEPQRDQDWRWDLPEDVRRPVWGGEQPGRPPRIHRKRQRR